MARYDYKCKECKHSVEIVKPIADFDREELCPKCDNIMKKEFNRDYAVDVKVSGFYGKESY